MHPVQAFLFCPEVIALAVKPLKPCKHAGCRELTREGWCPKHKPKHQRQASAAWHGWYNLPIWQRLRAEHLIAEPYCRECIKLGISPPARGEVVDHIVPFRGRWDLFVDTSNFQSLCKFHHDQKTALERLQFHADF